MTKKELIAAMAEKTEQTKKDTEVMLNTLIDVISEALSNGEEVAIAGLGKFEVRERAARTGRNPKTGESIEIAASKAPVFKASKTLKDAVKAE